MWLPGAPSVHWPNKQASLLLLNHGDQVLEIAGGNETWKATNLPMQEV